VCAAVPSAVTAVPIELTDATAAETAARRDRGGGDDVGPPALVCDVVDGVIVVTVVVGVGELGDPFSCARGRAGSKTSLDTVASAVAAAPTSGEAGGTSLPSLLLLATPFCILCCRDWGSDEEAETAETEEGGSSVFIGEIEAVDDNGSSDAGSSAPRDAAFRLPLPAFTTVSPRSRDWWKNSTSIRR
jgi:hypothetical protein